MHTLEIVHIIKNFVAIRILNIVYTTNADTDEKKIDSTKDYIAQQS